MPVLVFTIASILIYISIVTQWSALIWLFHSVSKRKHTVTCAGVDELFSCGVQLRNIAYVMMFFIFLISTKEFFIHEEPSLTAISNLLQSYASASCITLCMCIVLGFMRIIKKAKESILVMLIRKIRGSALRSAFFSAFAAYLLT